MIIELYKAGMEDCRTKMFDNLSFVSAPGDVVAITGGTLRGKSALLLSILGMKRLASGWASVDGEPVHQLHLPITDILCRGSRSRSALAPVL